MIYTLLLLLLTAACCAVLEGWERLGWSRPVALVGVLGALLFSLYSEGLSGSRIEGEVVAWPDALNWLGESLYRSDALSATLGAWSLLLGGFCLLRAASLRAPAYSLPLTLASIATLYSLAHVSHFTYFAGHLLALAMLAVFTGRPNHDETEWVGRSRQLAALGVGSLALLSAALIVGRLSGGDYSLVSLPLATITLWPLALLIAWLLLWLGLVPVTGWSGHGWNGRGALTQALVVGLPPVLLLLRLQALISTQGPAVTVQGSWEAFTTTLQWAGGITAFVGAASMVVSAGTPRWTAFLTAQQMGLVAWALGLDTPLGRLAALAILLAFGASRAVIDLEEELGSLRERVARAFGGFSLAFAPLTAGFVGLWLLGVALVEEGHIASPIVLLGIAICAACGVVLHMGTGYTGLPSVENSAVEPGWSRIVLMSSLVVGAALLVGGVAPALWLSPLAGAALIAGGSLPPMGFDGAFPAMPLAIGAVVIASVGWIGSTWAKSHGSQGSALLQTASPHLLSGHGQREVAHIAAAPPAPLWWASLGWLEAGVWGFFALLARLLGRVGTLFGRLEGRYYMPLALIGALLLLLAITRV